MSTHKKTLAYLHNELATTVQIIRRAFLASFLVLQLLATWDLLAQESALSPEVQNIHSKVIAAHIRFLADDLLEGRGPGTRGDHLTQLYISSNFERMGLSPGAPSGSWVQPVPLVGITTQQPSILRFEKQSEALELNQHDDFIAVSGVAQPKINVPLSEVVFVGYGITAPEYQWDDYAQLDVRGKIVLVMNNDPEDDPNLFEGRRRLYYGRWDYKYANAAAHGAIGAIIIHTEASAGYPYSVVQTSWSGEESELREDDSPRLLMKAWVTDEAAQRLASFAGQDLNALRQQAQQRQFKPVSLGLNLQTSFTCTSSQLETANVLGDNIYNGAVDNASGTAALLAIAEAFAKSSDKPRRSLLFAAVGAEEQGLLGSRYYAVHPTVSPGKIAGLVNMDSMNFLGRSVDIQVVGYGKSSIDAIVNDVAALQQRKVVPDQFIDRGYFYRSDQFSLAKIGVPGLYLHSGTTIRGKPDLWGRDQQEAWTKEVYHQPGDEFDPNWDWNGMVEDAQLLMEVTKRIANADAMQAWNPGDEFEAARKTALEAASISTTQ